MKIFKILGSLIVTVVLLGVIGVVLLVTMVSPNAFKGEISQYVHTHTGRDLTIHGDISWSFFPWLGFKITNADLSNDPNFAKTDFASIKEADINVRLRPLFSGKVEMGNITLKGLHLNLTKNMDGSNNWESLIQDDEKAETAPTTETEVEQPVTISIAKIDVSNASINWNDKQAGQSFELSNVEFHSKNANLGKPFPVNIKFSIKSGKPKLKADASISTNVTLDLKQQQYNFQSLDATIRLYDKAIPVAASTMTLSGDVAINLKSQTLSVVGLTLNNNGMQISADINGKNLSRAPVFSGQLQLFPLNLKNYLKAYGSNIKTRNPTALTNIALTAQFQASPKYLKLNNLKGKLDNTKFSGRLDYADFTRHTINFNLHADRLNLDDYLLAKQKGKQPKTTTKSKTTIKTAKKSTTIDYGFIRKANINGVVKIKKFSASDVDLNNITTTIKTSNGLVRIDPFQANLYGGTTRGNMTIDLRQSTPRISMNETLSNVDLNALLRDLNNNNKISGRLNINMNLTMRGESSTALLRTLNGTANYKITNGIYYGQNIDYQLSRAYAFIKKQTAPPAQQTTQTNFRNLSASASIKGGVVSTNNLLLQTQNIQVKGHGTANLSNQALNFYLMARGIRDKKDDSGKVFLQERETQIPLRLTGTFDSPKLLPDFAALGKMIIQEHVVGTVKEAATKTLQKTLEKGGNVTKEFGEQLKKRLPIQKLFGN